MTKTDPARLELWEQVLTRAAEVLGDLTAPAMALFYDQHPDALAAFELYGLGKRERLEAEMVDTALYCVMTWLERPVEVSIMLHDSVPHHRNTLDIPPDWYRGLLGTVIDLVSSVIPATEPDKLALVEEIRSGLLGAIAQALDEVELRPLATLSVHHG